MNRLNIPAIFKFAIGVLLVQGATVLLVLAAQQANLSTAWPLMLGLGLLMGLLAALWFSSIASHCSQHALARASEKFSRDRERIRRQSEKEKTREIKESHRQLLRETRRVHNRSSMKLAVGLAGLATVGVALVFTQFVTLFRSLFCEGFARPREGVRRIIRALVRRYRGCGGTIRMNCGVDRIECDRRRATALHLADGSTVTADTVLSSAGYAETMRLCGDASPEVRASEIGRLSFVESIAILDALPQYVGHDATIVFFNDGDRFHYAPSEDLVDLRSGVVCCPSNYQDHDDMSEGVFRVTWLSNPDA